MVRSVIFSAALLLATVAGARAQIDLTPKESFYETEGIKVPNVEFRNGTKKVKYSPPADWILSGGGAKVSLTPRDSIQAGATIEVQASREDMPGATEVNVKAYSEMALRLAPRDATKVEVLEAAVSPLQISGKAMIDVTLGYTFFGQPFRMNVLFMPRGAEQMRFQFTSRATDYPKFFKEFRSSLYSMQGL